MPAKNNKQSKLGSFFSKLSPNSPKKKLLLFVVMFGLIAGGYYAYRSFAATYWVENNKNAVTISTMHITSNSKGYPTTNGNRQVWDMRGAETNFVTPRDFAYNRRACIHGMPYMHSTISVTINPYDIRTKKILLKPVLKATGAHHGNKRDQALLCFTPKFSGRGKVSITVRGYYQLTKLVY